MCDTYFLFFILRGGRSSDGVVYGAFCVFTYTGFSAAGWFYGAAISFSSRWFF